MRSKLLILGTALVLGSLIVAGCTSPTPVPSEAPADTPVPEEAEIPEGVQQAFDTLLAHLDESLGDQAPASGLAWMAERTSDDLPGWTEYQFRAQDWVITVGHAVLPPEQIVYQIEVTNRVTGLYWRGDVDADGQVVERLVPEGAVAARDAALAHVAQNYGERVEPGPGQVWEEKRTTPEGLVGAETLELSTGDWIVTISYPVVAPDATIYQVVVVNQATGFRWEGEVDAAGQVTEQSVSVEPAVGVPDPTRALDAVAAFLVANYGEEGPPADLEWVGSAPPAESLVGASTTEYTAGDWMAVVSFPVVAPENVVYQVSVVNPATGFGWEGEVDAVFEVTELSAPSAGQPVACWYGRVEATPTDSPYDDYLILMPEELRRAVGLKGIEDAIQAQIESLRGSGTYAHFWGTVKCGLDDYAGCQLAVSRLRAEGPEGTIFDPDPVEGWTGTIASTPEGAQFDDYFLTTGSFRVRYGIDSTDPSVAAELESLRDTGTIVRVWGQVTCPAIDVNGAQVQAERMETVMEAPAAPAGYEGWKPHLNATFGYALWYPGECRVMGTDLDGEVTFSGNEWPVLTVRHLESDFYHPPAGTDVHDWITDNPIVEIAYDDLGPDLEIAGLPAVHLIHEAGSGWYASDEYYFIKDGQLFSIVLLHTGGQEDWELYDRFLQGITFP